MLLPLGQHRPQELRWARTFSFLCVIKELLCPPSQRISASIVPAWNVTSFCNLIPNASVNGSCSTTSVLDGFLNPKRVRWWTCSYSRVTHLSTLAVTSAFFPCLRPAWLAL